MSEKNYSVSRISRTTILTNFFEGIDDSTIDQLCDTSSNKFALIRAILLNPLDSVPLAMLIDELQNTDEYQKQLGCYKTWKQLYDKLLEVGAALDKSTPYYRNTQEHAIYELRKDIRNFLAPLIESNKE